MSWGTPDVYYSPEKFGLEIIYACDTADSYEFCMFVVWQDDSGHMYYATDSGCSCPSPFENYTSIDDLTPGTKTDIVNAMDDWYGADSETKYGVRNAL